MVQFIFDLDGTITMHETLPMIAQHFGVKEDIETLTRATIHGAIPFSQSLANRVAILGKLPLREVQTFVATLPTYPLLTQFIQKNSHCCAIATGNLLCWVEGLVAKLGCPCYHSEAIINNGQVDGLASILQKEDIVRKYQKMGRTVVFIGDGANDTPAMQAADIAIAAGLTHPPAQCVLEAADFVAKTEEELCGILQQVQSPFLATVL